MRTPRAERLHIGIFGNRNAGKSSLLNTITGQVSSIVSEVKGTTTDPIYKAMEIHGIGPIVFIDTAGLDDEGNLGELRVKKSKEVINKCDAFIYLLSEKNLLLKEILELGKPIIYVIPKADLPEHKLVFDKFKNLNPIEFISGDEKSKEKLISNLKKLLYKETQETITGDLVKTGDLVMLVIPQDIQAPKGRLILAQVQTIRELIDKGAMVCIANLDNIEEYLMTLDKVPDLIITDSQYFKQVNVLKPKESKLTSFSILFSAYKGDIKYFIESVKVLDNIENIDNILIAEACSHPPLEEDIGRVKIPNLLRKRFKKDFKISFTRGNDFYDIENYDLIIHCGSCMFNRSHMLSRVEKAKNVEVPMTNYGITIAYLNGILKDVELPI